MGLLQILQALRYRRKACSLWMLLDTNFRDYDLAHLGSHLKSFRADFISHTPMLDQYRRMYDVWRLVDNPYELTRDNITAIVGA
jgi:hypothetical protein